MVIGLLADRIKDPVWKSKFVEDISIDADTNKSNCTSFSIALLACCKIMCVCVRNTQNTDIQWYKYSNILYVQNISFHASKAA